MTELQDKTVVITGASRGVGEAAARLFADQGAVVVLAARSADRIEAIAGEIAASGGSAFAVRCDVAEPAAVASLVETALARTGRLDVLINNAGIIEPVARIDQSDPGDWGRVVDVNLKGVYYGLRYAIPPMAAQGGGTIINLSSGAATGALEGWSHYCATKAAVLSLTRCADKEYRAHGLRVVGLSPGTVATEMQRAIKESGVNPVSQLDWSTHIPPEWAAQALAYLCTPAADAHLGGDFSIKTPEGRAAAGLPAPS